MTIDNVLEPKAPARAQAQRDRILKAAQQCFVEYGFHSASMANIADTAGMSAGLIYRYFDGKDAIILAIIERQLEEKRSNIASLKSEPELAQRIKELFRLWQCGDSSVMNTALFLEMSAQAKRNPQIASALARSDSISRMDFRDWLRRRAEEDGVVPDEQHIHERALALGCFIEGLAIRAVREPDLDSDLIAAALQRFLPLLLSSREH